MIRFLPADISQIDDLKSELIIALELERGEGCHIESIERSVRHFATAITPLAAGAGAGSEPAAYDEYFPAVRAARDAWRSIDAAFDETLRLAYRGEIPRTNLLLAGVRAELRERAGDSLAASNAALRRIWKRHVGQRPWDTYRARDSSGETGLDDAVTALARGDDLDVEDAMLALTGEMRYAFADFIGAHPASVPDIEIGMWKRPDIMISGDYWRRRRGPRLIECFIQHGSPRLATALRTIDGLFVPGDGAAAIVARAQQVPEAWRDRVGRCLLLHPDHEVRRYAAENAEGPSIWKTLSASTVPCATVLSLLEHVSSAGRYNVAQRKLFFDVVYRRLLTLETYSDVLYARGIARVFSHLDFFLEDHYFERLMVLLDHIHACEKHYGITDDVTSGYVDRLRKEKNRLGSVPGSAPVFDGVPLVVLRRLARDGHFWHLLAMHSVVKVARETVVHILTPDRALRVAQNPRTNPEVLREIGRRHALFSRATARMALLTNPRTPPTVSASYVSDLARVDVDALLRRGSLHPEFRAILRRQREHVV